MEEIWKDIPGYEGLYQVSNFGRVRNIKFKNYHYLKPFITKDNCCRVDLCKNSKQKKLNIHRLVAITFIPNPDNKPQVDHIDRNRQNNNVSNLRWADKWDQQYFDDQCWTSHAKAVLQFSLDGTLINVWRSTREAARALNMSNGNITSCCKNKRKTAGGFRWFYSL